MDKGLRRLYGFSVLRFYSDFNRFLEKAGYTGKHPFVNRVEQSLRNATVEFDRNKMACRDEVFAKWQRQIKDAFTRRNFYGMMLQDLPEDLDMQVDARPLLQEASAVKAVVLQTADNVQNIAKKLEEMEEQHAAKLKEMEKTQHAMRRLLESVQELVLENGPVRHNRPQPAAIIPPSPPKKMDRGSGTAFSAEETSNASNTCNVAGTCMTYGNAAPWPTAPRDPAAFNPDHYNGQTCVGLFKLWFRDQLPVRYSNMPDKRNNGKARNNFSAIKKVVHAMLTHLDHYPEEKDDLNSLGTCAMGRLMTHNNLICPPSKSMLANGSSKKTNDGQRETVLPIFKTGCYLERDFPPGTPESVVKYFEDRGNNPTSGKRRKKRRLA